MMNWRKIHPIDPFSRDFLRLTLEIDKHVEGYIDAYYGPADLKDEVAVTPRKTPGALLDDVQQLQEKIPTADPQRHAYLTATVRALDCTIRMLDGETFDYLDEIERIYDIQPQPVAERRFTAAHQTLDNLLPGSGSLNQRLANKRKKYELTPDKALPLLELARQETRRRTAKFIELPDDESVEVKLAKDEPWGAYNWYLGNGRSLNEFNTDVPISALNLLGTFAHEGYPGHHTESMLKEITLYLEKGHGEQAAMLLHSPAAVIAEGIATTALEIIFPDSSHHDWNHNVLFNAAGLNDTDTVTYLRQITEAGSELKYVTGNAAILFHTGQLDKAQTIDYITTYGLSTPERAAKSFSFLSHPLYRSYIFTYTQGYDLIQQASSVDKTDLFSRLLTEQFLPSDLAAMVNN